MNKTQRYIPLLSPAFFLFSFVFGIKIALLNLKEREDYIMKNIARKIQRTETKEKKEFKVIDGKKERKITKEELLVSFTQKFIGLSVVCLMSYIGYYARKDLRAWVICLPMILFGLKLITTKKWWLYGERI